MGLKQVEDVIPQVKGYYEQTKDELFEFIDFKPFVDDGNCTAPILQGQTKLSTRINI